MEISIFLVSQSKKRLVFSCPTRQTDWILWCHCIHTPTTLGWLFPLPIVNSSTGMFPLIDCSIFDWIIFFSHWNMSPSTNTSTRSIWVMWCFIHTRSHNKLIFTYKQEDKLTLITQWTNIYKLTFSMNDCFTPFLRIVSQRWKHERPLYSVTHANVSSRFLFAQRSNVNSTTWQNSSQLSTHNVRRILLNVMET